jgi:hypothetical protein
MSRSQFGVYAGLPVPEHPAIVTVPGALEELVGIERALAQKARVPSVDAELPGVAATI